MPGYEMDGPSVIQITHPSFQSGTEVLYHAVLEYFQSSSRSGGGEICAHEKDGPPLSPSLLIKFKDAACESVWF